MFFFICRVLSEANREPQKPIDDEPVGRVDDAADGLMDRWKSLQWTQTPLQQLASLLKKITTGVIHPTGCPKISYPSEIYLRTTRSKIVKTVQNGPNGTKWSKQSKMVQTVQNGPNGPKRSRMVQTVQKSPKCKNGPKLSDMVQNGPNFPYAFPILKFQKDTFFWDTLYTKPKL